MTIVNLRYEDTGEVRPPRQGEWFVADGKAPQQAQFDFHQQSFQIVREVVVRQEES